jgi:glycosyltransferase involved in cell wall biosynthesis
VIPNPKKPLVAVFDMVTSIGGVQKLITNLMPRLQESFDIRIIDPYENSDYKNMATRAGLTYQSLGHTPKQPYIGGKNSVTHAYRLAARSPWLLMTAHRLRRWVAQNNPDILYFNQLPSALLFPRFLPPRRPALIYHTHGFALPADVHNGRYISRRFNKIFAVSCFASRQLEGAGVKPDKIRIVQNAVDVDKIQRLSRTRGKAMPERPKSSVVFVQVGVINSNKGQHLAVEALSKLSSKANLWICGDVPLGGDRTYLTRLKNRIRILGLEDRIKLLGWRDDVPQVLAIGDICILPSTCFESFGIAAAEAMALAKPCIGTNVGGIAEVIEDGRTGIIVQPNADSLANAMVRLEASEALRKDLGAAGLTRVNQLFSLSVQANRIAHELRGL